MENKEEISEERLNAFCQQGQNLMRDAVRRYIPGVDDVFTYSPEFSKDIAGKGLQLFLVIETTQGKLGFLATKSWDLLGKSTPTQLSLSILGPNDCRLLDEEKISILRAKILNRTTTGEGATDEDLRIDWEDSGRDPQLYPSHEGMDRKEELIHLAEEALIKGEEIRVLESGVKTTSAFKSPGE